MRPLPEWGNIIQQQLSIGTLRLPRAAGAAREALRAPITSTRCPTRCRSRTTTGPAPSGNGYGQITDAVNPRLDQGPADIDRRHALVASGAFLLPVRHHARRRLDAALVDAVQRAGRQRPEQRRRRTPTTCPAPRATRATATSISRVVNAWRAANGRAPISADQIDNNRYNRLDVRASKAIAFGARQRVELIGPGVQPARHRQPRRQRLGDQRAVGLVRPHPDRAAAAAGRAGGPLRVLIMTQRKRGPSTTVRRPGVPYQWFAREVARQKETQSISVPLSLCGPYVFLSRLSTMDSMIAASSPRRAAPDPPAGEM